MDTSVNSTNEIISRQSFVDFLNELRADYATNKKDWENVELETFLEAMASYAQDIDGFYKNTNQDINADNPSWKTFADILMGARVYE